MAKRRVTTRPDEKRDEQVLFVRVPKNLIVRLDAYVAQERARTGYTSLTRKDIVARLLDEGLGKAPRAK